MNRPRNFSNVIGFDDGPFGRAHRGDVLVVGAVCCHNRLDGVVSGKVRRDGSNAARVVTRLVQGSRFGPQIQLIMVQGIAFAGFNVIDLFALNEALKVPVLAVARREPDLSAIRRALLKRVLSWLASSTRCLKDSALTILNIRGGRCDLRDKLQYGLSTVFWNKNIRLGAILVIAH